MLKVQIERFLSIVKAMEHWPYSDTDYSLIRQKLESELQEKLRKAPSYMAYEKFNLRPVPECRITKNDLVDLIGSDVSITFYGPDMAPLYRKGVITELERHYIRLETPLAGAAYFIQYFRIIRVQLFQKRKVIQEIWYDGELH
jgi:hypothetical protein